MFGMGMPEILLLLAIALVVIGPKKLPDLAKSLGRAMGEFKKATRELKESIDVEKEFGEVKNTLNETRQDVKDYVDIATAPPKKDTPDASSAQPAEAMADLKNAFDNLNATGAAADATESSRGQAPSAPSANRPASEKA
jgi:sec-independent protein translocase protein TatB